MAGKLLIKSVHDVSERADGLRVPADRPEHGEAGREEAAAAGLKLVVAPSAELLQWSGCDSERFDAFAERYREELAANPEALDFVFEAEEALMSGNVTLVYAAGDAEHSSAAVLRDWMQEIINADPHEKKKLLRKVMRRRQTDLPDDYVRMAGDRIQDRFLELPEYQRAKSIFLYINMPKEPATGKILRQALEDGKHVYVPKCITRHEMLAVRIRSLDDLSPGAYGILEPTDCSETAQPEELELLVVPCVSACTDGRRLGHGAGYYDRFLEGNTERAVCLCFGRLLCPVIPMTEYDLPIPKVISEGEQIAD